MFFQKKTFVVVQRYDTKGRQLIESDEFILNITPERYLEVLNKSDLPPATYRKTKKQSWYYQEETSTFYIREHSVHMHEGQRIPDDRKKHSLGTGKYAQIINDKLVITEE